MPKPQIVVEDYQGLHNRSDWVTRLEKLKSYEDQSTVCIIPTRGSIPAKVVQCWLGLLTPMNQRFVRMFAIGMEVGEAYSTMIDGILENPELSTWKYVLTLEEDNMPPPDGLIELLQDIGDYDALGALYWTKGEDGQPMCYGRHGSLDFIPQIPEPNSITRCNGLGMGFSLFKMDFLKRMKAAYPDKPLFETRQVYENGGISCFTQDLWFFNNALKIGAKIGCSSKVLVGHYSPADDRIW